MNKQPRDVGTEGYRATKRNIADSLNRVVQIERPGMRYIFEVLEIQQRNKIHCALQPPLLSNGNKWNKRACLGFSLSLPAYASKQIGRPHSPAVVLKARTRSCPTKILDGLKYGHIQSQGCKSAKQQGLAP
jgi:hypothetical protein